MRKLLLALAILLAPCVAFAAQPATIFMDTGGSTTNSGTTDSNSATAGGTGTTITCSATSGASATPGCIMTGTGTAIGQLAGIDTTGNQALYVGCATNTNQKIFFITAVDNTTGAVSTITNVGTPITPTGCTAATATWSIGGRMVLTPANYESAMRPGDTILFNNSPASSASVLVTPRVAGDAVNGFIFLKGKVGVRPLLQVTAAVSTIGGNASANWWIENLELQTTSTASIVGALTGVNWVFNNVKFTKSSGGGSANNLSSTGNYTIINSEFNISNGTGSCAVNSSAPVTIIGTYFHGCGADAILLSAVVPAGKLFNNILSSSTGSGINLSGASANSANSTVIYGNTFYSNATAGLTVANANTAVTLLNNVFVNDGSHANVSYTSVGPVVGLHMYNDFYASAGTNFNNFTPGATEITANPLLNNPGSGDFTLQAGSPAINLSGTVGFPGAILDATGTGYNSLGAFQPLGASSSHCIGC